MLNTHDTVGGAAIACRRLIEALNQVDESLDITLLVNQKSGNRSYVQKVGSRFNLYFEKLLFWFSEKSKKTRFSFSTNTFGVNIARHPSIRSADIIHIHWVNQGFLSLSQIDQILSLNKPVFWTFHDMWPMTGGCHHSRGCELYIENCGNCVQFLKRPGENDLSRQILTHKLGWKGREKLYIVSISEWMTRKIRKSRLFANNIVYSIANPVDTSIFHSNDTSEAKKVGVVNILVVSATVDNDFKGFDMLVDLCKVLNQKYPDKFHLNLVGKISEASLKLISLPFTAIGSITDEKEMARIYRKNDLLLSTSPDESFSYTCLEALSCGTPIIAYDTGAIAEFINFYNIGELVRDYSLKSFEHCFDQYLNKAYKLELETSKYDYATIGAQMVKAYKSVKHH